jgi:tetratricopeptide (TPR) repeat protein
MAAHIATASRLDRLLSFIKRDAGNLALRKDTIREACGTGNWEIARRLIQESLQAHPQEAELLALCGLTCLQGQAYVAAERALSAALTQGVDAAEVRYNLAFALFMQRRCLEALEVLNGSSVLQALPLALLLRARCLHHLGRREEAAADCMAHLAAMPAEAEASGLLALILYEQGNTEAARPHAEAALQQNPKQLEAMLMSALLQLDAQEFGAARESFAALVQAHPHCGRGWLGRALVELSDMQIEAAKSDIERAAMYMPEHIGTWHILGWIRILQGDLPAAVTAFERALLIDRNFGETHGALAAVAAAQGRNDEARFGIRRARRLDPQSMSVQYAEMVLLQRRGRGAEAWALLKAAMERPTVRGVPYRDLIVAQMRRLHAGTGTPWVPPALH